jgi:hypothetical protein
MLTHATWNSIGVSISLPGDLAGSITDPHILMQPTHLVKSDGPW